jgi:hypothetical protein
MLAQYSVLPSYRAMLDREDITDPIDAALVGDENTVAEQVEAIRVSGVDEFGALGLAPDHRNPGPQSCLASSLPVTVTHTDLRFPGPADTALRWSLRRAPMGTRLRSEPFKHTPSRCRTMCPEAEPRSRPRTAHSPLPRHPQTRIPEPRSALSRIAG